MTLRMAEAYAAVMAEAERNLKALEQPLEREEWIEFLFSIQDRRSYAALVDFPQIRESIFGQSDGKYTPRLANSSSITGLYSHVADLCVSERDPITAAVLANIMGILATAMGARGGAEHE